MIEFVIAHVCLFVILVSLSLIVGVCLFPFGVCIVCLFFVLGHGILL